MPKCCSSCTDSQVCHTCVLRIGHIMWSLDPAFVAKGISVYPFEDQTQQMLALREDIRATLNDHRLFQEMHSVLMSGPGEKRVQEEAFNRILGRSRQVHFVQSPILLFPRWRRQVGLIRMGGANDRSTSVNRKQGMVMNRRGSPRASRGNKSNMYVRLQLSSLEVWEYSYF